MTIKTRALKVRSVLADLKRDLRSIYGVRLRQVILYSSHPGGAVTKDRISISWSCWIRLRTR